MRIASGFSDGRNPQRYLLGGMSNWINYKYRDVLGEILDEDIFFFSSFEGPLRGTPYYEMIGSRFAMTNLELRFPMIQYLILGGPLRIGFQNIRGVAFFDMGSAWSSNRKWKPFTEGPSGFPRLNAARAGYGIGARANLGIFVLRYDLAWQTDLARTEPSPIHYWSLGADF
jgi:outer membrane protein assembly factor BamA